MNHRLASKALSSLTLIIAGTAAAGAASAADVTLANEAELSAMTAIGSDLDSLRMSEFVSPQSGALAEGHHSDSIGSHHHHDAAKKETAAAGIVRSDARFDV